MSAAWSDALRAACLFAMDPAGFGGMNLRAHAGPVRDEWLRVLRSLLPAGTPFRRIPVHVTEARLLGGLDLAATLGQGRPVAESGLLAEADGGVLLLTSAERAERATVAHLTAALDTGRVVLERDGIAARQAARVGIVALDEGLDEDEQPAAALRDRLAFHLDLSAIGYRETREVPAGCTPGRIEAARRVLPGVTADERYAEALCGAALALGVDSLRASLLALRAARALAALAGRDEVTDEDAAGAARLVLAPRATRLPQTETEEEERPEDRPEDREPDSPPEERQEEGIPDGPLPDQVLEAARAALPAALLDALLAAGGALRSGTAGKAGAVQTSRLRGRPTGARAGELRDGARLNVIETLRAAAPWQPLRREETARGRGAAQRGARVEVRKSDFRITRFRQRTETTSIFVVDASGSAAMHRLAEAKGAVELLLADCYVRRDRVALIAFRGAGAELLLPPTRSLVRAKRGLAQLPGGGGTPLAAAIDSSLTIAEAARRRGETPLVVFLTDGRANVGRDGVGGRTRAREDALQAARSLRVAALSTLVIDTSPRARPDARELAEAMAARYLPLPQADAAALSRAVRQEGELAAGATHAAA
ncbi:magnesium chelatase subunit D [Lentisalinibacter orientalis]|uniref:magnesium chelatase subunit D n=1 Tax=Lentisalinibacter orientalis TaxID=2992241 RepID=UPI0038676C52